MHRVVEFHDIRRRNSDGRGELETGVHGTLANLCQGLT
jgi:hypothetical protein